MMVYATVAAGFAVLLSMVLSSHMAAAAPRTLVRVRSR